MIESVQDNSFLEHHVESTAGKEAFKKSELEGGPEMSQVIKTQQEISNHHTTSQKRNNCFSKSKLTINVEKSTFLENSGSPIAVISEADPTLPLHLSLNIENCSFQANKAPSVLLSGICSSSISILSNDFRFNQECCFISIKK